ncbi:MAG: hypothetical protein HEP71_01200 [Roseivirga sp.]|nr:hypothetical protein [Roseivirga sp.]
MKRILLVMLVGAFTSATIQAQIVHTDNVEIEKSGDAKLDMTDTGNNKTWQLVSGLAGFQIGYLTGNLTGTSSPFHIGEQGWVGINTTSPVAPLTVNGDINIANGFGIWTGNNRLLASPGDNTFLGLRTGQANTTGYYNTFIGKDAGLTNSTGNQNTFIGFFSGLSTNTGNANTFLGSEAGRFNTSGSSNTFIGAGSGRDNISGIRNAFVGLNSGRVNSTGSYNAFFGYNSGGSNLTGGYNMFIGRQAGYGNTSGSRNAYIGSGAGAANNGDQNVYIGDGAGSSGTLAHKNVAIGYHAGRLNNSAVGMNTFIGTEAGNNNTGGQYNVGIGSKAGRGLEGIGNVAIGMNSAGDNSSTGSYNVFLGYEAGLGAVSDSERLYVANRRISQRTALIYGEFDNGKVGINTTSPTNTLHVFSSDHGGLSLETANQKNSYISFHEQNTSNVSELKGGLAWDATNEIMALDTYLGGDLMLRTINGGSVGINATTLEPNSALTVGGKIAATEYLLADGSPLLASVSSSPWGTTGTSAITFNSGTVGIGSVIDEDANLHVQGAGSANGDVISSIMIGKLNGPQIQAIQEANDNDVQGLAFRVKSSGAWADDSFEAMRISKDGEVGIGTDNPETNLDVRGNGNVAQFGNSAYEDQYITIRDNTNGAMFGITPTTNGGAFQLQAGFNKGMRFMVDGTTSGDNWGTGVNAMEITQEGKIGINTTNLEANSALTVGGKIAATEYLLADGSPLLASVSSSPWAASASDISFQTGNVAIGTATAASKLHVNGDIYVPLNKSMGYSPGGDTFTYAGDDVGHYTLGWYSVPGSAEARLSGYGGIKLFTASTARMYISDQGDVGIGTVTPTAKLEVDGNALFQGKIESTKVRVSTTPQGGWPDYVFEPEFKLRPLSEVEAFVKDNKHLPEVPSAKEVEANGIDLGNMDATLLKKVEELTLYMIEMDKKLKKLEEENQELKKLVKKDK